ncbi:hypothetical protein [Bacillus cereus]|nr:hypothetical protein [Bacillus cereus]
MLIVITGSYISKLAFAVRYDKSEPEKSNHLEAGVFLAITDDIHFKII